MACYRIHGDEAGETHLTPLVLPVRETAAGTVRGLSAIPTTTTGMAEFVGGRKPDTGIHDAPQRQFVLVLGGVLEIVTSTGEAHQLRPGDLMLADDVGTKGHHSRDVGEEPLMMMTVGIQGGWGLPGG